MLSQDDHYRAVFEASLDATLIVDAEGRILDLNEQAAEMFGWSREALTGASVERLVPTRKRGLHLNTAGTMAASREGGRWEPDSNCTQCARTAPSSRWR